MEKQPFDITLNGESFELNHHNSVLITYIAELAIHNHLRFYTEEDEGYVFQDEDGYAPVATYMIDKELPMALNLPVVHDRVVEEHASRLEGEGDIDEEVEEWRRLFEN